MNLNVTAMAATVPESGYVVRELYTFLMATRAELCLFCTAVVAYMLLFGNAHPTKSTKARALKSKRVKVEESSEGEEEETADAAVRISQGRLSSEEREQFERSFASAFESGDHRLALKSWSALKRSDGLPAVPLSHVVESMQRLKKDTAFVVRELKALVKRYPGQIDMIAVNDLIESLTKRLDSELVDKVMAILPSLNFRPDQRTYELLLTMHFTTRSFSEVRSLLAQMTAKCIPLTTRANIVAVKTALKTGNFDEATRYFGSLRSMWAGHLSEDATPSAAPRHIVSQIIELACKEHHLAHFLPMLDGILISEEAANTMLSECIRRKDSSLTMRVEKLVRAQGGHSLSDATYTLLVKALSGEPKRVNALFDEVVQKGAAPTLDFALALLIFCNQTRSVSLADRLFEFMKPKQLPVLSAFIRFYTETEQFEKACQVYENHVQSFRSPQGEASPQPLFLDARIEKCLMTAALRCGKHDLAKCFLDASPSDVAKHITMIRNCAATGNLQGAMKVFESLQKSGAEVNSIVYNTVLDACVECKDLSAAESWMKKMKEVSLADVVSYNTLIKAHLQCENFRKARGLMEEMRSEGLQPNRVTFNELVNGLVTRGTPAQRAEIWGIVKEMRAADVKPNQVTCSILLKSLNSYSSEPEILETMDLISSMEEPMDEVLLSSVVEACVRIGKPELLAAKLKQLQTTENVAVNGSHTFGSLIKAYGHAKDIDGVWRCWKEMRSRHIRPTSITLGCMVEAVVSNGDTEGAYDLIHQMQDDERCRDALNAVIYCSVLKGFTREKKIQRVWAVYEEMLQRKVDLSVVTYNTLLDACARCGRMDRAPAIVENMRAHNICPNLITYSTMVKGHCQESGDIERGFAILEQMQRETDLKPDEIMYNSLLDGCAQHNLAEEGLSLLERMQREGVQPSNFTLSLLVKLMNRCRKLDKAFNLVDDITRKYRFRPNVHVFTNLIQACIANRQLPRGMSTFDQMLKERVRPESRTYCILVRASLMQNSCDQAVGLLRAALGLPGSERVVSESQARLAAINNLDYTLVSEVLQSLVDKGRLQDIAVPLLSDLKRCRPDIRVNSGVQHRVMSAGMAHGSADYAQDYEAAPRYSGRPSRGARGAGGSRRGW